MLIIAYFKHGVNAKKEPTGIFQWALNDVVSRSAHNRVNSVFIILLHILSHTVFDSVEICIDFCVHFVMLFLYMCFCNTLISKILRCLDVLLVFAVFYGMDVLDVLVLGEDGYEECSQVFSIFLSILSRFLRHYQCH